MKRIPVSLTLWSPCCRAMKPDAHRGTVTIHLGTELVAYCCHGALTVMGLPGQYFPS